MTLSQHHDLVVPHSDAFPMTTFPGWVTKRLIMGVSKERIHVQKVVVAAPVTKTFQNSVTCETSNDFQLLPWPNKEFGKRTSNLVFPKIIHNHSWTGGIKINASLPGYKHRKSFTTKYVCIYILDVDVYMGIPDFTHLISSRFLAWHLHLHI